MMIPPPPPSAAALAADAHPEVKTTRYRDKIAALESADVSRKLALRLIIGAVLAVSVLALLLWILYA